MGVESPRFPDQFPGGRNRPFNYLLFFLGENRLMVNARMLGDDFRWWRGDGFTIEF